MFDYRDYIMRPRPQSQFAKLFGAPREYEFVRKARYRGVGGRHLHNIPNLTREEAKHFLLHDRHGRELLRDTGADIDTLAEHLIEASMRPAEKREASNMTSTERILKNLKSMGEHEYVAVVTRYAKSLHPTLTREQAFSKVFGAQDAEGRAIRQAWLISKGRGLASGPLDEPDVADEADEIEGDALSELEELAAEERRRNPLLTKAQSFAKAYTNPANADLAQRERRQARRKIGVA